MADKQAVASGDGNGSNIHLIRGQKVMLSVHLAEVYGVEPGVLMQAIERNIGCFPEDSVFQLNTEECTALELATSIQTAPYAFTREGVAILSSALFDERALHESRETCAPTCGCRKA